MLHANFAKLNNKVRDLLSEKVNQNEFVTVNNRTRPHNSVVAMDFGG